MATNQYSTYLDFSGVPKTQTHGTAYVSPWRATAPATTAAPTTVNYRESPSRYGSYLESEYASPIGGAVDAQGRTAYDIQRERIRSEGVRRQEESLEDLKRRLAAMGADDSGMAFKLERGLKQDVERGIGQAQEAVTAQELAAREARAERLGSQAFEAEQAGIQREFVSSERGRELIQEAWKFTTEAEFKAWARTQDIADKEADMAWQARENELSRGQEISRIVANTIANMATMNYEDVIASRKETRDRKAEYYRALGGVGDMDEGQLEQLRINDPDAYYAYKAGESGMSLEQIKTDLDNKAKVADAILVASADDPSVIGSIIENAKTLWPDIDLGGYVGEGYSGEKLPSGILQTDYSRRLEQAPGFNTSVEYKTGGGVDNGWYFNSPPAKGEEFKFDIPRDGKPAKLYRRTDDEISMDKSGPNKEETQYIMVEDLSTGKVIRIDARAFSKNLKSGASGFPTS